MKDKKIKKQARPKNILRRAERKFITRGTTQIARVRRLIETLTQSYGEILRPITAFFFPAPGRPS